MATLAEHNAVLKAAADPVRVRILKMLEGGELCACQVVAVLDLPASTVSKHLSVLKTAGLVRERKAGKWVHYGLPGRDASPLVRQILKGIRGWLVDDPVVAADAVREAQARDAGAEAVCAAGMKLPKGKACCTPNNGGSR